MLVPVGSFEDAKRRLAGLLTPDERVQLMRHTIDAVLTAAIGAAMPVTVLSPEPRLRPLLPAGVQWLDEVPGARGLNPQLEAALPRLGAAAVLIAHGDLPLARPADFTALASLLPPAPAIVIATSSDGGTNALLMQPPGGFPLHYGTGSATLHARAAQAAGYTVAIAPSGRLALDLDTHDSLATLMASPEGRATPAGQYLAAIGIEARLRARATEP